MCAFISLNFVSYAYFTTKRFIEKKCKLQNKNSDTNSTKGS